MAVIPTAWNPADKDATVTLSGGDLIADSAYGSVRSTASVISGKYYWELTFPSGITQQSVGVGTSSADISYYPGFDSKSWALNLSSRNIESNGSVVGSLSAVPTTTVSVLLDADAQTVAFWADGVPASSAIALTAGPYYAIYGYYAPIEANFGATAFNHTPPAGYEAGFGVLDPNTTVIAGSALAFSAGAPTAVRGPNRTVQAGSTLVFSAGTPEAKTPENETVFPAGVAVFAAGAPTAVRGPNRTAQADGALVFGAGEPAAQLGYPETIEPAGAAVFAAGQPTAFPWSNRTVRPSGVYVGGSGSPMALRGMPPASTTLTAPGARAFASGTPSARNTVTVQAQGASVFAAGTPKTYPVLRAQGVCAAAAGTPKALAGLRVAGAGVFYAGVPSARATAHVQGVCVVRAGVPTTGASAVAQGQGVLAFGAGVPRISGVTVSPRTAVCFRSGTPTINRGATC